MTSYQPFSTPSPLLVFPSASPTSKLRSTPTRKLPTPVDWTKEYDLIYSFETNHPSKTDDFIDLSELSDENMKYDDEIGIFEGLQSNRKPLKYRRHSTPDFLNLYDLGLEEDEEEKEKEEKEEKNKIDKLNELPSSFLESLRYKFPTAIDHALKYSRSHHPLSYNQHGLGSTSLHLLPTSTPLLTTTTPKDTTFIENNINININNDNDNINNDSDSDDDNDDDDNDNDIYINNNDKNNSTNNNDSNNSHNNHNNNNSSRNKNDNNTLKNLFSSCYSSPNASLISLTSSISSSYVSSYSNGEVSSHNNSYHDRLFNDLHQEDGDEEEEEGSALLQSILLENKRSKKKEMKFLFNINMKKEPLLIITI
ncbi:unnamed protein product [Cunninghamella blakesleeana]